MGGDGDLSYWTNSVMEVVIGEEAKLGHSYIQTQSLSSAPIKWTSIQQYLLRAYIPLHHSNNTYELVEVSMGGKLSRHNVHVQQVGYTQRTDAGQLTRSLVLEQRATVNVKPNLQIIADDAKCSHGAAICDLKEDQLCYLQARGIDLKTARKALIVSFGAEVIDQFPSNDLRKKGKLHVKKLLDPEVHVENYV
ncbi:hypothetical protein R6Q59_032097 [Mikania micrantha]